MKEQSLTNIVGLPSLPGIEDTSKLNKKQVVQGFEEMNLDDDKKEDQANVDDLTRQWHDQVKQKKRQVVEQAKKQRVEEQEKYKQEQKSNQVDEQEKKARIQRGLNALSGVPANNTAGND